MPKELQPLAQQHAAIAKAETVAGPLISKANTDYTEHIDTNAPVLSAPVQAGKLSSLMKTLASAESAVNNSIKARNELIQSLETILDAHREKVAGETETSSQLSTRRAEVEVKRREVEDIIFRRVSAEDAANGTPIEHAAPTPNPENAAVDGAGVQSPEMEGFTPPRPNVEDFTPNGTPEPEVQPHIAIDGRGEDTLETDTFAADTIQEQEPSHDEPPPSVEPPPVLDTEASNGEHAVTNTPGADLLRSLKMPGVRSASAASTDSVQDPRKRRKMSHKTESFDDQFFATGDGVGLDADVAANLGAQ